MLIVFENLAWEDYLFWQKTDKKILQRINKLITETKRDPFQGLGKPEPLKYELSGAWSRRINSEHRLVYKLYNETLVILQCRYHY